MSAYIEAGQEFTAFIIDTDTYAGNFERDMVAYMTGVVGECGVGEEGVALFKKDGCEKSGIDFEELVDPYVIDEHGCGRPASIWPTPGTVAEDGPEYGEAYHSVALWLAKAPSDKEVDFLVTRARKFVGETRKWSHISRQAAAPPGIKILGFRVIWLVVGETLLRKIEA